MSGHDAGHNAGQSPATRPARNSVGVIGAVEPAPARDLPPPVLVAGHGEYRLSPQVCATLRQLIEDARRAKLVEESYMMGVRDQLGIGAGVATQFNADTGTVRVVDPTVLEGET